MAIHNIQLTGEVDWLTFDLRNDARIVLASDGHELKFEATPGQPIGSRLLVGADRLVIEFSTGGVQPVGFTLDIAAEVDAAQQQLDLDIDTSHAFDIISSGHQITIPVGFTSVSLPLSSATHVITETTTWYGHPAQATPPNGELSEGTRVVVLSDAGSYTNIQTEDGSVTGYVSTDALVPIAVNPGDDQEAFDEQAQESDALTGCAENPPPWENKPWRTANCLKQLQAQVNNLAPTRKKASDGTIGDIAHQNRTSDHNPHIVGADGKGIVTAIDITHDPQGGCDCNVLASVLQAKKDARIKYVIWNRRIMNSSAIGGTAPWIWRPYTGENPHTKHIHISVLCDPASYDAKTDWDISAII